MKKRNYEETHENILERGLKLFLKEGYEKANLRQICKNGGVTTGAFYKHFEDKADLFTELVKPLADSIEQIYHNYEDQGFIAYSEDKIISKKTIEEVLALKKKGSIETVKYLFSMKELFELLIFQSYGTQYENYLDLLISAEDKNQRKILNMIHGEGKSLETVTDKGIHLIDHAFYNALSYAVTHSKNEKELVKNAEIIIDFFNEGWKKFRES